MPERIPNLTLPSATDGAAIDLRASRGPRVVIALHDPACAECLRYVREIASVRDELAEWGADVVIVSPVAGNPDGAALADAGVPVVEDADHAIAQGRLALIVTDQWGEVYHATGGDSASVHDVVPAAEVVEWVKFVAIQCPECEGPEGGWRDI